jgi:hypothetical protein
VAEATGQRALRKDARDSISMGCGWARAMAPGNARMTIPKTATHAREKRPKANIVPVPAIFDVAGHDPAADWPGETISTVHNHVTTG